ncbi:MAG: hypothetical protein HY360_06650 [Verrucomicrobia bacterium]|nr:hypothetical protein [Verrucomicrobiota bacterium]
MKRPKCRFQPARERDGACLRRPRAAWAATLRLCGLALGCFGTSLGLADVRIATAQSSKLIYHRHEAAEFVVSIKNQEEVLKKVKLTCQVIGALDESTTIYDAPLALGAQETKDVQMSWSTGDAEFGFEFKAILADEAGKAIDSKSDYFGVADNVFKIGQNGGYPQIRIEDYEKDAVIENAVKEARRNYIAFVEFYGWAPDDFGNLTPALDEWRSGQGSYYWSKKGLKKIVAALHANGISAISYGKGVACGYDGFDLARKHPEWIDFSTNGHPIANFSVEFLDAMKAEPVGKGDGFWNFVSLNFFDPKAVAYGAQQLIASSMEYGFNGVRFDGQFSLFAIRNCEGKDASQGEDRDKLSRRNVQMVKQQIWRQIPNYLFGYNWGDVYENFGAYCPLEFAESCKDGGLVMNETIRASCFSDSTTHRWRDFARATADDAAWVRQLGGHYFNLSSVNGSLPLEDYKYQSILTYAAGAHIYNLPAKLGLSKYTQFTLRYSALLYDPALKRIAEPRQWVEVKSEKPLWWEDYVYLREINQTQRQIVVHLINPPPSEMFGSTTTAPPPRKEVAVRIRIPEGDTLQHVWLLTPDSITGCRPLQVVADNGWARASIPDVNRWIMVVAALDKGDKGERRTIPTMMANKPSKNLSDPAMVQSKINLFNPVADSWLHAPVHPKDAEKPAAFAIPPTSRGIQILHLQGLHYACLKMEAAAKLLRADVRASAFNHLLIPQNVPRLDYYKKSLTYFPRSYAELAQFNVMALADIEAGAFTDESLQMIKDFVDGGGKLLVFGGHFSLGNGHYAGTVLEEILPVKLRGPFEVRKAAAPLPVLPRAGDRLFADLAWTEKPAALWRHQVNGVKEKAEALLTAGGEPFLVKWTYGKGRVIVCLGTVYGELPEGTVPFWEWSDWPKLLSRVIGGQTE